MRQLILNRIKHMKENGGNYFNNGWTVVDLEHEKLNDNDLLDAFVQLTVLFDEEEE